MPDGKPRKVKFSELFLPGRDTLIVYNMMFPRHKSDTRAQPSTGPFAEMPREETPCPSCTALLDQLDPAVKHLVPAGFNFAVIAKAPIERLAAYREGARLETHAAAVVGAQQFQPRLPRRIRGW